MYKLLLATNDPAVVEAFSAVKWEELGFKQPRVVSTAEEALSSLRVNHADAVAIGLPKEQDDLLVEQLLEKNPMLPIMAVSTKPGVIESYAVELRRLLGRINADVSNDAFSTADLLKECRHEFFRALMDGRATSEEDVLRHLARIAFGRVNDAVELALRPETANPAQMDLSALSELKVTEKGVELKLVDRIRALETLFRLLEQGDSDGAEGLYQALEAVAGALGDEDGE